mgnify:CR=1 FL=1
MKGYFLIFLFFFSFSFGQNSNDLVLKIKENQKLMKSEMEQGFQELKTLEKTADVPVGFPATIQQEKQPETPGKSIPASVEGLRLSPAAYGLMREFGVAAPVV